MPAALTSSSPWLQVLAGRTRSTSSTSSVVASVVISPPPPSHHHSHHAPRPQSVEGDVQNLIRLRQAIRAAQLDQQELIQLEHAARQQVELQYSTWARQAAQMITQNWSYVSYIAAQREHKKSQVEATKKVHHLFSVSIQQQRESEQLQKDAAWQQRRKHAEHVRNTFHITGTGSYIDSELQKQAEKHEASQQVRLERLQKRYVSAVDAQSFADRRAEEVRKEHEEVKRRKIVATALERYEKKKLVERIRSESKSPTTFLKLPPLRDVFKDDTLVFSPQTLLTRNYQSTYRRSESAPVDTADGDGWLLSRPHGSGTKSCGVGTND